MLEKGEEPFSFDLIVEIHTAKSVIQHYLEFSSEVEDLLGQKIEGLYRTIDHEIAISSASSDSEIVESYAEDLHKREMIFTSMHRASLFLTLYSYLEDQLNKICKDIGRELHSRVTVSHIAGKGITRAFVFLDRVTGFVLAGHTRRFFLDTNKLRNIIVHNGSVLPEDRNHEVHKFIKTISDSISGSPGEIMQLEKKFLELFAYRIVSLFDEIEAEMQRWMKENA